jgi:hypothetical protein
MKWWEPGCAAFVIGLGLISLALLILVVGALVYAP